jgi:hypothetical protein
MNTSAQWFGGISLEEGTTLLRVQPTGGARPYVCEFIRFGTTGWIVVRLNENEEHVNVSTIHSVRIVTPEKGYVVKKFEQPAKREYPEGMPGTYLHPQEEGVKT